MNDLNKKLIKAARKHDFKLVKQLVLKGADVNCCFGSETPLLLLADSGHDESLDFLIDKGANTEAEDMFGNTALFHAINPFNHIDSIRLLIERGANVNHINKLCVSPLNKAVKSISSIECIEALINAGAIINRVTENEKSLFADLNASQILKSTALHEAVCCDDRSDQLSHCVNTVDVLLKHGADTNAKGKQDMTPLVELSTLASLILFRDRTLMVIEKLVQYQANVNAICQDGNTALMNIVERTQLSKEQKDYQFKIARFLIEKGCDLTIKNFDGNTALDLAKITDHQEIIDRISFANDKNSLLSIVNSENDLAHDGFLNF